MNRIDLNQMADSTQFLTSAVSLGQVERGMLVPSNRVLQHKEVRGQFSDALGVHFRFEDTAGHSWHSALVAMELAPLLGTKVDLKIVLMTIAIHDLSEIELKDTIVFREKKPSPSDELDAMSRQVQTSHRKKDFLRLFQLFQDAQELRDNRVRARRFNTAVNQKHGRTTWPGDLPTVEAVFSVAAEALSPCFVLLSTSKTKAVELWQSHGMSRKQFEQMRFAPVCDWDPFLKKYSRYLLEKIEEKIGWPKV